MKKTLLIGALLFSFINAFGQVKVSQLPAASTLTGAEQVPVTQGGVSKRTTTLDIAALGGGGGTTYTAGYGLNITGSTIKVDTGIGKLATRRIVDSLVNAASYSAGTGLGLSGRTFYADTTKVQSKYQTDTAKINLRAAITASGLPSPIGHKTNYLAVDTNGNYALVRHDNRWNVLEFGADATGNPASEVPNRIVFDTIMARIVRAGGGVMYFPRGHYYGNVTIPDVGWPGSGKWIPIGIEGENVPVMYQGILGSYTPAIFGASIIHVTSTTKSAIKVLPSASGGPNAIIFHLKNLEVWMPNQPGTNGIDAASANQMLAENIMVSTGQFLITRPSSWSGTGVGFNCPTDQNGGLSNLMNCNVQGFYIGFGLGDHTTAPYVTAYMCEFGIVQMAVSHPTLITRYECAGNKYNLGVSGTLPIGRIMIQQFVSEHMSGAQATWADVYDPAYQLRGDIVFATTQSGINGGHHSFVNNSLMRVREIGEEKIVGPGPLVAGAARLSMKHDIRGDNLGSSIYGEHFGNRGDNVWVSNTVQTAGYLNKSFPGTGDAWLAMGYQTDAKTVNLGLEASGFNFSLDFTPGGNVGYTHSSTGVVDLGVPAIPGNLYRVARISGTWSVSTSSDTGATWSAPIHTFTETFPSSTMAIYVQQGYGTSLAKNIYWLQGINLL